MFQSAAVRPSAAVFSRAASLTSRGARSVGSGWCSVGSVETVAVDSVRWIRSAGNYVELHLAERCVLHRVALSRLEEHLDADCFLRVHRTALVRRNLVRGLRSLGEGSYQLWLDGGDRVPVSERHLPEVRAQLELGTEVD